MANNNIFDSLMFKISAACVVAIIAFVYISVDVIDEGQKAVVLNFGEISKTWEPGLHFKIPLMQTVSKYNTRLQKTVFGGNDYDILSAYSYDQQIIESYRISITWKYDESKIEDVYKHFGNEYDNDIFYTVVSPLIQQTSKTLLGQNTSQTIVQNRGGLNSELDKLVKQQLVQYPIIVIGVQIEDINFSKSYENIIEQTAQKKQEVEKAKNELQRIEIESKQEIAKAESHNKAIKLQADAKAYSIQVQAEAEANAIKLKTAALKENKEYIDLTIAEKWNGNVPNTVVFGEKNSNVVPLFNLNSSSSKGN